MDFGLNKKVISFIGLFFLASISLHSFAHIDESPLEFNQQSECLTCHNEISADIEITLSSTKRTYVAIEVEGIPKTPDLQLSKPFFSQAPPKIKI